MVKIPDRPDGYIARGALEAPAPTGSREWAALGRAGRELFGAALLIKDQRDHDLLVEAQNAYNKGMTDWRINAEQSRQGAAASGLTRDYQARHLELKEDIEAQMKERGFSQRGVRAFGNWATGRETAGMPETAAFEHRQLNLHGQDMHALRLQSIAESLEHKPASYKDAFAQLEESFTMAVGQGIYRQEQAQLLAGEAKDRLRATAFENLYSQNRGAAMAAMNDMGLSASQQARAQKRFEADLRADAAQARAANADQARALTMQIDDVDYLARQTGEVDDLRSLAAKLSALGEDDRALKLKRQADLYENNAAAIKESRVMPLPELAESIRNMEPRLAEAAAGKDADGHRLLSEEAKLRAGVFEERRKALMADPAGAVAEEAARALPEEAGPGAVADMRLAIQSNNGLPQAMQKVLSADEAAALQQTWKSGDLGSRLALVGRIDQYGPHAGKVAAEIGLAPAEQLLAMQARNDPRAAGNLAAVISATAAKAEDLPKVERAEALEKEAAQSSAVATAAKAAAAALPGAPALQALARNYEDTLGKLVRMNNGDAQAAAAMLDGRLKSMTDGGNFALIYDSAEVAGHDLEAGLRAAMDGQALEDMANSRNFADHYERVDWLDHMRRNGIWLNAPDADGYILFDPVAQAPAMDRDGNVLRLRDKELLGAGTASRYDPGWQRQQEKVK